MKEFGIIDIRYTKTTVMKNRSKHGFQKDTNIKTRDSVESLVSFYFAALLLISSM